MNECQTKFHGAAKLKKFLGMDTMESSNGLK